MHFSSLNIFLTLILTVGVFSPSYSQLFAPERDWSTPTQYINSEKQDSVFLFFSSSASPVAGRLRAQFSDSSASTFTWYKYNDNLPVSQRFQPIVGLTDSVATDLERGGYRVQIKRISDDSTEVYTAWVMIDDVEIESLSVWDNRCERLILEMKTMPLNSWDISQLFTYFDLSSPTHQEKTVLLQGGYFRTNQFTSNNVSVPTTIPTLSSSPYIYVEYENELNGTIHGPLEDATYTITVVKPFGGENLVATTPTVTAISTKTDFDIYFNEGDELLPDWQKQDDNLPNAEALLEMKLESLAENSDSIFWRIFNDPYLFLKGGDSIIWRDSSVFDIRFDAFPSKKLMVPGTYKIEHISLKSIAGCRDTLYKTVVVDSAAIDMTSFPNVFSPNGDQKNDFFVFSDPENEITSIKSFEITILSRWGQRVYFYSGDPKTWEGWNGKIDGTKGDAAPGVYYFVIDAVGWDGRRFRDGLYKGFLHLFR